jgi:hypothetical protein
VRERSGGSLLVTVLLVLAVAACGTGGGGEDGSGDSAAVPFTAVDLPAGATPVVLSAAGDELLVGVRWSGRDVVPGLLRRGADGVLAEVPVRGATPYGLLATWYSVVADGDRIVAVGGERGGAHGNVRWSVWSGTADDVAEQPQGFSTFGGWGAGELVGAVATPAGPVLIGSWQSARSGLDVAAWTADGDAWTRQASQGTALESDRGSLGFPVAAAPLERGVLVAGWRLVTGGGETREEPVVWRSTAGTTGWTAEPLPGAGGAGAALAARCGEGACAVAGRVDGALALWRLTDGAALRVDGTPSVAVGEDDRMAAPVEVGGRVTQVVSDGERVRVASADGDGDGDGWTVRDAAGPVGAVTAATRVGDAVYVLAGPGDEQRLWRADVAALG